jgi:hypothetical protein
LFTEARPTPSAGSPFTISQGKDRGQTGGVTPLDPAGLEARLLAETQPEHRMLEIFAG